MMPSPLSLADVVSFLLRHNGFLILTHRRPDGDTSGCAGALCEALRHLGKTAYLYPNPESTERYLPLVAPFFAPDGFAPLCVITVDMADSKLFPKGAESYLERVDLAIDHHASHRPFARAQYIDAHCAACGEILYQIIMLLGVPFTQTMARALYTALSTDTGCFRFSNTTPQTLTIAATCLATGIDGGEINRQLFETKSRARFELEKRLFASMEFAEDGRIALVHIRQSDLLQTGATMDDLDAIAALPRQIEGVEIGITITELADGTGKVSVRTNKEVDAAALCAQVGGGGHVRAAGASFATFEEACMEMLALAKAVYA